MERMRMRVSGIGVLVGLCCIGVAHDAAGADQAAPQETDQREVDALRNLLGLTDAQRSQVQQITQEYQSRSKPLTDQLDALRQDRDSKIKALLTPQQQARYDQLQQRRKEHRQARWQGDDGQGPGTEPVHPRHGGSGSRSGRHRGSWGDGEWP